MNEYIAWLLERYGRERLFVDTNILLLLVVGSYDRSLISRFKRTLMYTQEDYDLAAAFVGLFEHLVTTSSVLTEVSNLAGQLGSAAREQCFAFFARFIELLQEQHIPSVMLAGLSEFPRFGLTDSGVLQLARGEMIVLTDDLRLAHHMEQHGLPILNFTHLRAPNLLR